MKTPSSLNLLNGILESSKESVIFALDSNYCYLAFNENHRETMRSLWGVDIKVGDTMLECIRNQGDRNKAKANFDRALNGENFTVVEQYGDESRDRRWYQNEYNPLYDDSGNVIGLTVFLSDITERKRAEEGLKESEERFMKMLSLIPDMVSIQDPDMNIVYSNWNGFAEVPEEDRVLNTKCYRTYRGYENICPDCLAKTVLDTKEPMQAEVEIKEGIWVDLRVIPMLDKDGNVEFFIEWVRDITNIKNSELALKEKEELLREYFDKTPAGINIIDKDGDYLDANFVSTQVLGCTKEELLSHNILDFVETPYHEMITNWLPKLEKQGYVTGEVMVSTKYGKRIWTEIHVTKLDKDRALAFSIDVSKRKQAEEELRYLSYHDSLTGLYNRNYFDREVIKIDNEKQLPLGIIMVDINGLKLINDTYGQNVGNEVLKSAANIIRKSCREEDIVVRWGGDEFVILLPKTNQHELENIQKNIKSNSEEIYVKDITVSVALTNEIKETIDLTIEEVIKKAEDNMQIKKLAESRSVRNSVLKVILNTLQAKSYETETHTQRMLVVAWQTGEKLELPEDELSRLELVITLHDIGKINISENTLTKKGKLTDKEWQEMKKHPEIGYKIARSTGEFSHVAEEILSHHERWDGNGYPRGLKGKEIPFLARITAIVDAYEVMSNGRPYKDPMSQEEIIAEFRRCAGTQFDPSLVDVFINILSD